jgi:hypothetical protein
MQLCLNWANAIKTGLELNKIHVKLSETMSRQRNKTNKP